MLPSEVHINQLHNMPAVLTEKVRPGLSTKRIRGFDQVKSSNLLTQSTNNKLHFFVFSNWLIHKIHGVTP